MQRIKISDILTPIVSILTFISFLLIILLSLVTIDYKAFY